MNRRFLTAGWIGNKDNVIVLRSRISERLFRKRFAFAEQGTKKEEIYPSRRAADGEERRKEKA